MNKPSVSKKIHEYEFHVNGLGFTVKGKILQSLGTEDFRWVASHYYRGAENAQGVYRPSRVSGTLDDVTRLMFAYMESFTAEHGFEKNEFY